MSLTLTGQIQDIIDLASKLQKFGTARNIVSVFDDGGYRELLLATLFDLKLHSGRHGDDAEDKEGNSYELKTVNLVNTRGLLRKNPGITTCHHVNKEILFRYRNLHAWLVGVFFVNEPVLIYEVPNEKLKHYFDKWEKDMKSRGIEHLNNPKISFSDIRSLGIKHFENEDLVARYINGGIKTGTEVFKDVLTIQKTHIKEEKGKIEADSVGV